MARVRLVVKRALYRVPPGDTAVTREKTAATRLARMPAAFVVLPELTTIGTAGFEPATP